MKANGTAPTCCIVGHKGAVNVATFNSDGEYCMTAGDDRVVKLWNPHKAALGGSEQCTQSVPIKEYSSAHNQRILDVAIAKDNHSFASCGGDRTVFVWDVTSGLTTRRLVGHEQRVNCVRYGPECSTLITGSYDKTVRCWDMRSRNAMPLQILTGAADSVTSVDLSAHEIIVGSVDGTVLTYDLRKGSLVRDSIGPPVAHVAVSGDGNCLLVSTLDSALRLLDRSSGQVLCEYHGHTNESFKLTSCLSPDDAWVLSGSETGTLHAWDLVEGKGRMKIQAHSAAVVSLSCHPTTSGLLTASHDGTVKLWERSALAI